VVGWRALYIGHPKEEVNDVEEPRKVEGLSVEELEAQHIELLPDREAMQDLVNVNIVVNVNIGAAAAAVQGAQVGFGQANQGAFDFTV
jgi:hypothetical protein